jgi:hypothetical protein
VCLFIATVVNESKVGFPLEIFLRCGAELSDKIGELNIKEKS